jgi:hypothetical protein
VSALVKKKSKVLPFPKKGIAKTPGSASNVDINASSGGRHVSLPEPELRVAITRIVHDGRVWQTRHAGQERDSRNVSDDDIQSMLLGPWVLERKPEWSEDHRNWKYRLRGTDIEGEELTLIVAIREEEQTLAVVTKF